jgi:hypothetical protein
MNSKMKSKAKKNATPGAWIVNPKDRGRKSIKNGNIYLKDGQEFEIEIFNPLKINILADIRLNGNSISTSGLIIKPGQREYLDCFIDDGRKFKFETYQVENSNESKEAISDNGALEVLFYKEDVTTFSNWRSRITLQRPRYFNDYDWYYPYNNWYGTCNNVSYSDTNGVVFGSVSAAAPSESINNCFSSQISDDLETAGIEISNNIETGRVEKGEESKQEFVEIDMDFEQSHIHSILYKLLPESHEPKEVKKKKKKSTHILDDILRAITDMDVMRKKGILTDEEFKQKKSEFLSRM